MAQAFKNPPVVEAWIEFRFALTREESRWDEDVARRLMATHFKEFTPDSFLKCTQIDVKIKGGKPDFAGVQTQDFFDRIRAFSQEGDHCIQAGRNVFVFNQIKKDSWGKYERLRDCALACVKKYMEFRALQDLIGVSLHYRDIVTIPKTADSGIKLNDWFRVYPEVPDNPFRTMSAFKFSLQLPELCKGAFSTLSIQSLPLVNRTEGKYQFSIDVRFSHFTRPRRGQKKPSGIGAELWAKTSS